MNPWRLLKAVFASAPRLTPAEGAARVRAGTAILVDVREPGEWPAGVAQGAELLPLSDLTGARTRWRPFLERAPEREILLYCVSGGRSAIAARILVAEGRLAANAGRLGDWRAAGWRVTKPRPAPV